MNLHDAARFHHPLHRTELSFTLGQIGLEKVFQCGHTSAISHRVIGNVCLESRPDILLPAQYLRDPLILWEVLSDEAVPT